MKQFMSDSDSLKGDYIGFNSFVFLGVHSTFKCFIFQPYGPRVRSVMSVGWRVATGRGRDAVFGNYKAKFEVVVIKRDN